MDLATAQMLIMGIESQALERLLLWTPGWAEWIGVKTYLESSQRYFARPPQNDTSMTDIDVTIAEKFTVVQDQPDEENSKPTETLKPNQDFHGDQLTLEHSNPRQSKSKDRDPKKKSTKSASESLDLSNHDRRRETRHQVTFEVILINRTGKTLRCKSSNVSLSGILLQVVLPKEFVGQTVDLILIDPTTKDPKKSRILFKSKVVGEASRAQRLNFVEPSSDSIRRLNELLTDPRILENRS